MSLVTVFADNSTAEGCKDAGNLFYASLGNGDYVCTRNTSDILNKIEEGKSATITVLDNYTVNADITLNKNMTYDLNGHTVTFDGTHKYTVEGANVTFKNGTIVLSSGSAFEVNGSNAVTALTVDATVESTTQAPVVSIAHATKTTTVNINGNWEVKGELVSCTNSNKEIVNLNAKVIANLGTVTQIVSINAGAAVVNVLGGSYESNKLVFSLTNGTLNINAGTVKSTGDQAIIINEASAGRKHALSISGGTVVTEAEGKYALYFNNGTRSTTGTYKITDGTFTSGKDSEGKQLPALYINDEKFLDYHKAWISKGTFTEAVVGNVKIGDKTYKESAEATKILVGNATVKE